MGYKETIYTSGVVTSTSTGRFYTNADTAKTDAETYYNCEVVL